LHGFGTSGEHHIPAQQAMGVAIHNR
jgi:hypothetical protein